MHKVFRVFILLFVVCTLALFLSPAAEVNGLPLFRTCPRLMTHPDTVRIWDMHAWASITLDRPASFIPASWDASRSTWRGYNADNPFGVPEDSYPERYNVTLRKAGQEDQWIWILVSKTTPETDYVWVFTDTSTHPDASGQHNGTHPCRVFSLDAAAVKQFFSLYSWTDEMTISR